MGNNFKIFVKLMYGHLLLHWNFTQLDHTLWDFARYMNGYLAPKQTYICADEINSILEGLFETWKEAK